MAEDIGSSGRHLGRRWTRTFGPGRRAAAEHARLERSHPSPCEAPNAIQGARGKWAATAAHFPLARLLPQAFSPKLSLQSIRVNLPRSTRKEVKNMVHYRRVTQAVIAVAALCVLGMPNVSLAAGKAEEGFVSLFDGKTLDGWQLMNGAKFVVEDGVLKHDVGLGWLQSDKEYADFILRLQFRFLKPKRYGHLFLRSVKAGENWPNQKYEVQIENTARMAMIFGAPQDLNVELVQKVLKPDGDWNAYDIKIVGSRLEVRLNGELVNTSQFRGHVDAGLPRPAGRKRSSRVSQSPHQRSQQLANMLNSGKPSRQPSPSPASSTAPVPPVTNSGILERRASLSNGANARRR